MASGDFVALWKIRCVNRNTKELFDRTLFLDPSTLPPEESAEAVAVLKGGRWDRRVLNYRGRFRELPATAVEARLDDATHAVVACLPDYFEDELGNPMAPHELVGALTGEAEVLLLGDPRSVLALGPSPVKDKGDWSPQTANKVARFLQVGRSIAESRWLKSPLGVAWGRGAGPGERPLRFQHPDREAMASICVWIRQLWSSDKAFDAGCNAYIRHVADERKALWVRERKTAFNRYLERQPESVDLSGYSAREVLETVIYGSGVIHTRSASAQEEDLRRLLAEHGGVRVTAAFYGCCMEICTYALDVYPVIKQDFEHWVRTEGCAPPTWPEIRDLLP